MKNEDKRDQLYEQFYAFIKGKKKKTEADIRAIFHEMRKVKTPYSSYEEFLIDWIFWAIASGKRDEVTELFKNRFYKVFIESKVVSNILIPIIACSLVGLLDLVSISLKHTEKTVADELFKHFLIHANRNHELLIVGDTGTGKELIAKAVHLMGDRNKEPFEEINCAAITDTMLESELFGHKKGAFTGATANKKGLLELAGDGIIFLDEIGKMPGYLQAKLLKVIQDKEFRRVGDTKIYSIRARFIAAIQPNDLKNMIPDLKYRFNYPWIIKVPTLKERMLLNPKGVINSALFEAKRTLGEKAEFLIKDETVSLLLEHEYDGNYRELRTIIMNGICEAIIDNRTDILPKDVSDMLEARKAARSETYLNDIDAIKLRDIFDYAQSIKKDIIEKKIINVMQGGKDLKTALAEEGMNSNDYQNFRKKFQTMTGKRLRDFDKNKLTTLND